MYQNACILGYDMPLFDIIKFCIAKPLIIQAQKYSLNSGINSQKLLQVKSPERKYFCLQYTSAKIRYLQWDGFNIKYVKLYISAHDIFASLTDGGPQNLF